MGVGAIDGIIGRNARMRPDELAVVFEDRRLTWRELHARTNRVANGLLALGLRKGDKLATFLPNCLEVLDIYWAAAKTGIVVVPLNPLVRGRGLASMLDDADAVALVTTRALAEHLEPIAADLPALVGQRLILVDALAEDGALDYQQMLEAASDLEPPDADLCGDDLYNIMYSSGTTGDPKGIVHTHGIRAHYCLQFAAACRIQPESVVLHSGSLSFNGAFISLAPAFLQGSTYVLLPSFDVDRVLDAILRERVTHIVMVPSQIVAMLRSPRFAPERLRSLEMVLSVGAPLHLQNKEELMKALPGRLYELYGLTEGFATILDKTMLESKPGSVGAPMSFCQMKILDDDGRELPPGEIGEIVGRGLQTMPGYYKRPDLTEEAIREGWLHTGDLGYVDEDGFLYLVDRKKDLLISGGVNVYPRDIEEVIVQHPDVVEAAVFGVDDDRWGEPPVAAVVQGEGSPIQPDDLRAWINERVSARFQKVSAVVVYGDFPRSAAGKTLKGKLREDYSLRDETKSL